MRSQYFPHTQLIGSKNHDSSEKEILLVYIHGGPGLSHDYFLPLMSELSKGCAQFAYDQGTFVTDSIQNLAPEKWTVNSLVDELAAIIKIQAQGRKVILVAHSFGSIIAIEYAKKYDSKADLVLLAWIYDNTWIDIFLNKSPNYSSITEKIGILNSGQASEELKLQNNMIAHLDYYFQPQYRESGKNLFQSVKYYPKITKDIESTWESETNTKVSLALLEGSILSVAFDEDQIVYPEYIATASKINQKIQQVTIQGGHFSFFNNPAEVATNIKDFLFKIKQERL